MSAKRHLLLVADLWAVLLRAVEKKEKRLLLRQTEAEM